MPRVIILHGPNLNLLGTREPAVYGHTTLADIDAMLVREASSLGVVATSQQDNSEGGLIDALHAAAADGEVLGVVLNAGAYAHTSLAIADAVRAIAPLAVIEVHVTNTAARGGIRERALVGAACQGRIEGFGGQGYLMALRALIDVASGDA